MLREDFQAEIGIGGYGEEHFRNYKPSLNAVKIDGIRCNIPGYSFGPMKLHFIFSEKPSDEFNRKAIHHFVDQFVVKVKASQKYTEYQFPNEVINYKYVKEAFESQLPHVYDSWKEYVGITPTWKKQGRKDNSAVNKRRQTVSHLHELFNRYLSTDTSS